MILQDLDFETQVKMTYFLGFDAALKKLKPELTDCTWPENLVIEIIAKKYTEFILSLRKDKKISLTNQTRWRLEDLFARAVFDNQVKIVELILISQGRETDILSHEAMHAALFLASQNGHSDCLNLLLLHRKDIKSASVGVAFFQHFEMVMLRV